MAHDGPRPCEVVSPDKVGGLHAEAHRNGTDERSEKPGGRLYEADGGRGFRSQTAHHRSVDVEHQHRGDLCQDRGYAQLDDEV